MMNVIGFINSKGGVDKFTIACLEVRGLYAELKERLV